MKVIYIIICFLFAAVFHQALYILIPITTLFYLSYFRHSKMQLNGVIKLYLGLVATVIAFFLLHSVLYLSFEVYSVKGIARYVSYLMFAIILSHFDKSDISNSFKVLIVYFALSLPIAVYQFLELGRYQNIFSHANHLAYVLVMCIYFLIFYKPFTPNWKYVFLALLFVSLIFTKSSGAMLVLLGLWAFSLIKSKKISSAKKLILLLVFIGLTILILNSSEKISSQINTINYLNWDFLLERAESFKAGGYGSFIWRIVYWLEIIISFLAEPFYKIFFGLGVDSLTKGNMPYEFMYKDPHNDFLKILVEYGVLGLILFLGLIMRVYYLTKNNFYLIILIIIPLFFGNAIVNFPFNIAFIMIWIYEYKRIT